MLKKLAIADFLRQIISKLLWPIQVARSEAIDGFFGFVRMMLSWIKFLMLIF